MPPRWQRHEIWLTRRRLRLLECWWAVAEQVLADGRNCARQLEQAIWVSHKLVVTVTPFAKIMDSCGKVLSLGPPTWLCM